MWVFLFGFLFVVGTVVIFGRVLYIMSEEGFDPVRVINHRSGRYAIIRRPWLGLFGTEYLSEDGTWSSAFDYTSSFTHKEVAYGLLSRFIRESKTKAKSNKDPNVVEQERNVVS